METVECPMNYIGCRWNFWQESEGSWFNIREVPRFEKGKKYRVILPTDLERGLGSRFFMSAFNGTDLNPDNFEFPGYERQFEEYKRDYADNPWCSWNNERKFGTVNSKRKWG